MAKANWLRRLEKPKAKLKGRIFPAGAIVGAHTNVVSPFKPGNQFALRACMTEEAHAKRMAGLKKAWATRNDKMAKNKFVMSHDVLKKVNEAKRARLKQTQAKDAREIQELIRTYTFSGLEKIFEILANDSASDMAKIAAMHLLLDRGSGRAAQTNINANIDANGKPSEVSQKELDDRIRAAIDRVEALTGGAPKAPEGSERPSDVRKLN